VPRAHTGGEDQSPVASRRDLRYWNATAADLPKHPLGY